MSAPLSSMPSSIAIASCSECSRAGQSGAGQSGEAADFPANFPLPSGRGSRWGCQPSGTYVKTRFAAAAPPTIPRPRRMIVDRRQETPTSIQAIGIGFLLISVATPIGKHDRRRRLDVYREECQMSTNRSNRRGFLVVPIACALLAGCGVSQEKYDALAAQNAAQAGEISSLKQQVASRETHVARL